MPSLRDLFGGLNQSADSVQDTPGCAARGVTTCPRLQYDRFSGGNPTLKPEKAKSVNLGFVLQPTAGLRVSADYFMIEKTDELGLVLAQFVIDNVKYVPGATATLNGNPVYAVTRNAGGTITSINTSLGNLGQRKIRGADFGFERRFTTDFGKLSLEGSATYYEQYDYADLPTAPLLNRLGYLNLPRWRSQIRAGIERGSFEGGVTFNSRARMLDRPQSQAALAVTATTPIVGSFDTLDLSASYTGMKNLRVTATAKNITNRQPPFSNNDPRTLGFSQMDSIVGRFFTIGLAYQF